eukprot:maker-scaffold_76-snap-gene-0.89-mRNA-1 protein AED:0.39 eAED:0.47 QI:0/0/0/1/0/0/2/0/136
MFLFEDVNFLFEQPNLIGFAAAAVKKDNSIQRNYFQINSKPSSEDWFRAYEKELTKLIDIGKMVLMPKAEGSGEKSFQSWNFFLKNMTIFVARGDLQEEYLKFYSPMARLELIRMFLFTIASKNMVFKQLTLETHF